MRSKKRLTAEQAKQIRARARRGAALLPMAKEFGVSYAQVRYAASNSRPAMSKRREDYDKTMQEIMALREDGMLWKDIADLYGYSSQRSLLTVVSRWKRKQCDD